MTQVPGTAATQQKGRAVALQRAAYQRRHSLVVRVDGKGIRSVEYSLERKFVFENYVIAAVGDLGNIAMQKVWTLLVDKEAIGFL